MDLAVNMLVTDPKERQNDHHMNSLVKAVPVLTQQVWIARHWHGLGKYALYLLTLISQATVWEHEWSQWAPTNEVWESR